MTKQRVENLPQDIKFGLTFLSEPICCILNIVSYFYFIYYVPDLKSHSSDSVIAPCCWCYTQKTLSHHKVTSCADFSGIWLMNLQSKWNPATTKRKLLMTHRSWKQVILIKFFILPFSPSYFLVWHEEKTKLAVEFNILHTSTF